MARSDSYEELIESSLDKIECWVESGATDKEVAEKLGISYSTYRKYKSASVALKGRIATAKDKKNQEVEKALFKNCKGYDYYEDVVSKLKVEELAEDGETILTKEVVEINSIKKHSPPNLGAQKYWLNNREKMKWQEDPHKVTNDKKLTKIKEKEADSKEKMMKSWND